MRVEVLRPGIHAAIQDLGRAGFRRHGVSVGGALDPMAARIANLLVGNAESAAVIETALGGLRLRFTDERAFAWYGAPFEVHLGRKVIPAGRACRAEAGEELRFVAPTRGMRAWLAISGGIDVPLVLGSRSTDVRARFGGHEGRLLREGDLLRIGTESSRSLRLRKRLVGGACASWGFAGEPCGSAVSLRVVRDRNPAPPALFDQPFIVTPDSDRMGLRLSGMALVSSSIVDVSEAVAPGTIQLPPSGQPIVLLADCQTIGGYPRIGHVITADLGRAAQIRPGDPVRFCEICFDDACALQLSAERTIGLLRAGIDLRLE